MTQNETAKNPKVEPISQSREFDAPRELMFKLWTECEHIRHWFGPKSFTMQSCEIDFKPSGKLHYCIVGPNDAEMWGLFLYREIEEPERVVWVYSFSDEGGSIARNPYSPTWPMEMLTTLTLEERGAKTMATVAWVPINATPEELKAFEEGRESMIGGLTGTFQQLEEYLSTL